MLESIDVRDTDEDGIIDSPELSSLAFYSSDSLKFSGSRTLPS